MTGVFGARDVVTKQLELYEELVPRLHRVLTLVDPTDPRTPPTCSSSTPAPPPACERPLELDVRNASDAKDLKRVFRTLRAGQDDGAFVLSSNLRLYYSALILQLAKRAGLPVQAHRKEWVEQGALFSFGSDLRPIGRAAARYVDSHSPGHGPGRPGRPRDFGRRVRDQSRDGQQARHQGPTGHDHQRRRGLSVADEPPRGAT